MRGKKRESSFRGLHAPPCRDVDSRNKTTQPPVQHILNKDKELLLFASKTLSS